MRGPMSQPPPMQHPAQQSLLQQPLVSPHFQQNSNNLQNSVNQFNQRLLQEIQQNHPLLSMNRSNNNNNNNYQAQQQYNNSNNVNGQYHQQQQHQYNRNNSGNVVSVLFLWFVIVRISEDKQCGKKF
jgi:DNA topoisomerase 2-associated protein PAT1